MLCMYEFALREVPHGLREEVDCHANIADLTI